MKTTQDILTQVHALCLQSMHELGSIREVDRTLAQTLMAEFGRLHAIINEDLIKSLLALRDDLEASGVNLVLDIARVVDFQPDDPRQFHMRAALRRFQRVTSMKVDLPLAEFEVAVRILRHSCRTASKS